MAPLTNRSVDALVRPMKLSIVIATAGRRTLLLDMLAHLERQRRLPDEVIVSAPDETHVEPFVTPRFLTTYLFGHRGSCAQRNHALTHALDRADIITFFDDDFLPADDYLQTLAAAFASLPDCAVISGNVVVDGVGGPGLSFADGLAALRAAEADRGTTIHIADHIGAYGCNMSVRAEHVGTLRFDERLVLYGWQEDIDFTSQLRGHGRIVSLSSLIGVHLGAKSGRSSGTRLGYSQVMNPVYLMKKGTMPASFGVKLVGRNVAANLTKSLWPEPYIDRRGRLKGNLIAAYHLIKGRVEPEYILQLPA